MSDWLTPEQLAAEWGVPVTWVKTQMAAWPDGGIPNVSIGKRRWFTPACKEALEDQVRRGRPVPSPEASAAEALAAVLAPAGGWGQVTRPNAARLSSVRGGGGQ